MPLRLEIKRQLSARSDRVKCVDMHATEPWMLASLYSGHVHIWNYETGTLIKTFEVTDQQPVRAARFVHRKNWVLTASDDMQICVFNYNTLERLHRFEAHSDYIRSLAVHPTQPYVLTSSDDMSIKLWDWEKKWQCTQVFEGHTHYVMAVMFNPKDTNTFASASLDRTIKVWQLGATTPNFTLQGHEKGVNCLDYFQGGDKPYLVSGADDRLVKIWDYQNKTCVQTLDGHTQNVCCVCFHPELPVILTGSEDGTVRVWHANTYRLENTLNYGLERSWSISYRRGSNSIAVGYDEGSIMIKLGREEPAMSMDQNGKIVIAKHNDVQQANVSKVDEDIKDGEAIPLSTKDLGSCEIYPQTMQHNPNGRFVVVCGDGEFIVHTALAFRNKAFGQALEFVWAADSSQYATRENSSKVKIFKNFKEKNTLKPDFSAEGIYGGLLLSVRGSSSLSFYDWESTALIRRIDIEARNVIWAQDTEMVAVVTEEDFFILKYNSEAAAAAFESGEPIDDEGIEEAFEVVGEISDTVKGGLWIGDCFIYTNNANRVNYYVGGEIVTIAHLDRPMYLLGYLPGTNRLYLADKDLTVVSYKLAQSVLQYQTAVMRGDFETADAVMPQIPTDQRTRVAQFLEKQGFKEEALVVSSDPEHKFDLALGLRKLLVARDLAREIESEHKWKQLGEIAMKRCLFDLAEECMEHARDFSGLLMLYSASGKSDKMDQLARSALDDGKNNLGFLCHLLLGRTQECVDVLVETDRLPEAAMFARTYCPSQIPRILGLWKDQVGQISQKQANMLADPTEYENLFPDYQFGLKAEDYLKAQAVNNLPASKYQDVVSQREIPLADRIENDGFAPQTQAAPEPVAEPEPEPVAEPEPKPEPVVEQAPVAEAAPASPSKKGTVIVHDEHIEITEQIHFAGNKADINEQSHPLCDEIANVIIEHPHIKKLEIGGHCSDTGDSAEKDEWELELSKLRAEAVRAYLIAKGVEDSRLVAKGYGDTVPIGDNKTKEGRAMNRRVEFKIISEDLADDLDLDDDDLDLGDVDVDAADLGDIDDEDLLS